MMEFKLGVSPKMESVEEVKTALDVISNTLEVVSNDYEELSEKYDRLVEDYNYLTFRMKQILDESDTTDSCLMKLYKLLDQA
jgi:uncharacterized protein YutD